MPTPLLLAGKLTCSSKPDPRLTNKIKELPSDALTAFKVLHDIKQFIDIRNKIIVQILAEPKTTQKTSSATWEEQLQ